MSTTIDEKIVEMRFDNRQFEQGVSTTMSSLDKLKEKLSLKGSAKAVQSEFDSYKSGFFNFKDSINKMWSSWEYDLANRMKNMAKNLVQSITTAPVKAGFSEYETQMGAIQTILANTKKEGTNLDDVNGALDELNTYADKTIYNFTEMTRNIGTFTAAGVKLDTSVQAIKGIANLAAVSGSTSQQASTAMYQLSQAMASGTVKLMDWNSVVNAGMGGQVFQDALKETAKVHGIEIDKIIEKNGSFRESLQEGWLTTEILTDTLAKFTGDLTEEQLKKQGYTEKQIKEIMELGDMANKAATEVKTFSQLFDTLKEAMQSGWSQTWRILVGDFEEAKEMLTKISDTLGGLIGKFSDARNELLENWKVLGGRQDLIDAAVNIWDALLNVIKPISEAFREIFPPMTAERLVEITRGIKDFTAKLKLSDKGMNNLKRTFKGVFAVVKLFWDVLSGVVKVIWSVVEGALGLGGGLLGVTATIGDLLVGFVEFITYGGILEKVFSGVAKVVKFLINVVANLVKGIAQILDFAANGVVLPGFNALIEYLHNIFDGMFEVGEASVSMKDKVSNAFSAMGDALKSSPIFGVFSTLWTGIKKIGSTLWSIVKNVFGQVINLFAHGSLSDILDFIKTILSGGLVLAITNFIKSFGGVGKTLKDVVKGFNEVLDSVSGALGAFENSLNAKALKEIAIAIAILAGAVLVLSFIKKDKLMDSVAGILILFTSLAASMAIISKGTGLKNLAGGIGMVIGLSIATLLLASALAVFSKINPERLSSSILSLAVVVGILVAAMRLLTIDGDDTKVLKGLTKVIIFAYAIKMLAKVIKDLGSLDWDQLGKGLIGLTGCVALLTGAIILLAQFSGQLTVIDSLGSKTHSASKSMKGVALAMLAFSAAILMLVPSILILGSMDRSKLIQAGIALAAITGLLVGFVGASKLANPGQIATLTASLLIFAIGVSAMLPSILILGLLPTKVLIQAGLSVLAIGGILVGLAAASKLANPGRIATLTASMIIFAAGINSILPSIMILGLMPTKQLIQAGAAMVVIGGILVGLAAASKLVNPGQIATMSASLIILAIGMSALMVPLMILGAMPWQVLVAGLVTMAAALTIFGVAGALLAPIGPAILIVAAAFAVLGVGMAALGVGLALLVPTLIPLSAGLVVLAAAAVAAAGIFVTGMIGVLGSAVVTIVDIVADILIAILDAIIAVAPKLCKAIVVLIGELIDAIYSCLPKIVDVVLKLIVAVLQSLVNHAPTIIGLLLQFIIGVVQSLAKYAQPLVEALFDFVIAILDGISAKVPDLIVAVVDIIMSVFEGAIKAMKNIDPKTLVEGLLAVGIFAGIIAALAAISGLIPSAIMGALGMGVIAAELALVFAALGGLAQIPGLKWLIEEGGELFGAVGTAIGKFIGGIAGGIAEGFTDSLPQIGTNLSDFMKNVTPFIEGAKAIDSSALEGVYSLVGVIVAITAANVIESISRFITGGNNVAKFSAEIVLLGQGLKGFASAVSGIDAESTKAAVEVAKGLAEMTNTIPNSGGIVSWLTGDNSIAKFGADIILLGHGLKGFASAVSGIDCESAKAAVEVARGLADMTNCIPNSGGMVSWFTGDNSISLFSAEIVLLGLALKGFSSAVSGIDCESTKAAVEVAKGLAEMTNHIPNSGGLLSWLSGDNSVANFSFEIKKLGKGLADFAESVSTIEDVEKVKSAIEAAKALAEMTNSIPNSAGVVSWFAGDNSISKFAGELPKLGTGLKGFATEVEGINTETVTAAVNAAKTLAELTNHIPNAGGVVSWFSGESSVSKFGTDLIALGKGIKGFATEVEGVSAETVTPAAEAAKTLAEMTNYIPEEGGVKAWFAGETSVATFADSLVSLGKGLKGFSDATIDIKPESMTAAANAAKSLAEMTKHIPTEGGIKAWFTGETSVSNFANKLPTLGKGLKGFSDSVVGINPENVTAAAEAAKHLAEMTKTVPKDTDKIIDFGTNLETFGTKLAKYFTNTSGITEESTKGTTSAIKAVKSITEIDSGKIKGVADAIDEITKAIKKLSESPKEFDDFDDKLKKVADSGMDAFVKSIETKGKDATTACSKLVDACAKKVSDKKSSFESAGKALAQGLADGISANSYLAEAKAKAMAEAAAEAARKALDINSPSKVFRALGYSIPEGLAVGIEKLSYMAVNATKDMTSDSINGVKKSLSRITEAVNSDIDAQPTIRPVLDLSDIKKGANSINSMLGTSASLGVSANIGAINSSMRNRNQNGTNNDVVSELTKLRKDLANSDRASYNINGVTFSGGDEVEEAFKTILRAAKIERRM